MDSLINHAAGVWHRLGPALQGVLIEAAFFIRTAFLTIKYAILFLFTVVVDPTGSVRRPINLHTRRGRAEVFLLGGSAHESRLLAFFWRGWGFPRLAPRPPLTIEGAIVFAGEFPVAFRLQLTFDAMATLIHGLRPAGILRSAGDLSQRPANTSCGQLQAGGVCRHPPRRVDVTVAADALAPLVGRNFCPNL